MLRIHFTATELARSRMVAGLGPMAEGVFALRLFTHNGDAALMPWRRRVRADLGLSAVSLEALVRKMPTPHTLLAALDQSDDHERSGQDTAKYRSLLAMFVRVAVLPHWKGIKNEMERVREARARVALTNGLARLLDNLHPTLQWNDSVLEVAGGKDRDVSLGGQGLVLSPSFFLSGQSCVFVEYERETGGPVLFFPMSPDRRKDAWRGHGTEKDEESALGSLVGHTRAAALQALTDSCTTGELADRLGISLAGASKHAAVLRHAGLITTSRNRNKALHILTSLGMALLQTHEQAVSGEASEFAFAGPAVERVNIPALGGTI